MLVVASWEFVVSSPSSSPCVRSWSGLLLCCFEGFAGPGGSEPLATCHWPVARAPNFVSGEGVSPDRLGIAPLAGSNAWFLSTGLQLCDR